MYASSVESGRGPDDFVGLGPVSGYPRFEFSMKQVLRAGEALRGELIWSSESRLNILEVFQIANNFRDAHAYPMRKMRLTLGGQIKKLRQEGHTVARLKRMPSIRRKLKTQGWQLNQIQDLAGCRAILPKIDDVNRLVEAMRSIPHALHREYPYIERPKDDGYRCHHMVFKFRGDDGETYFNDRRVEVQIRTRLQHAWATAVEAVGLFRREDIKGGAGDPRWRRLFLLMSAEFARIEGCAEGENVPDHGQRLREIKALESELRVLEYLENSSQAVRYTDKYYMKPDDRPDYYQIVYNRQSKVVSVQPYWDVLRGVQQYDSSEIDIDKSGDKSAATVLVEADGIEALKLAYPNYFGDIQLFKHQLSQIVKGMPATEYVLPPQTTVPKKRDENANLTWFKRRIRLR